MQAASAPSAAGIRSPRPAPTAITMNTTSSPSSSTALKAVMPAIQSREVSPRATSRSKSGGLLRRRSRPRRAAPSRRRRAAPPCAASRARKAEAGCRSRAAGREAARGRAAGRATATIAASTPSAASAPEIAGRQPRSDTTASTMVNASTTSTIEARKAEAIAGTADDQTNIAILNSIDAPGANRRGRRTS